MGEQEVGSPMEKGDASSRDGRRNAILLAGHSNAYSMRTHGDFSDMFVTLLAEPGEHWQVFPVVDVQFSAVVITGSKFDAHGDDPWIIRLRDLLRQLHEQGRAKLLGVCFGHQALAHALGGKSGRAECGLEGGIRELQQTSALSKLAFARDLPAQLRILEVHQDQVQELPPGAVLLASSERTPVEMFMLGENILGIQGHPEFWPDDVESIIEDKLLCGMITPKVAAEARETLAAAEPTQEALRKFCLGYLKG